MFRILFAILLAALPMTAVAQDTQPVDTPTPVAEPMAAPMPAPVLFRASDFGSTELATELLGPIGLLPPLVVVYQGDDLQAVQEMYPSDPTKGQDYRYVSYDAAMKHITDHLATAQGRDLITLGKTRSKLRQAFQASQTTPQTQPAATTTSPAARKLLDELEQAGATYTTLQADLTYSVENSLTHDVEIYTGAISFQQKTETTQPKFRIQQKTLQLPPGPATANPVDYLYGGDGWFTVAKHKLKQVTRYQIAAEGQQIDPFAIGQGPFPVPFGQKTEQVLELTTAMTREPLEGDPADTDFLQLIPKADKGNQLNFVSMKMWISRQTHLPVKVIAHDASKNVTTVEFTNIRTQTELSPELFVFTTPAGWAEHFEAMR